MEKKKLGSFECLEFQYGGYTMRAIPEMGGQVVALEKEGLAALRAPQSQEELQTASTSYGFPILFPPNRIDGGHFTTEVRSYQFAVNEAARGNSLHGFLHKRPWQVNEVEENRLQMVFEADETTDFYEMYPHAFRAVQTYELSENGLEQIVCIQNRSQESMPIGLGFHSAFTVDDQTKVRISVGRRILMSERMLPTGEVRELNEQEQKLRANGLDPNAWSMDDHYTAEPIEKNGTMFHGAIVERAEGRVVYEVDPFYQHWMIWNAGQRGDIICLEPQNWRVNAPNLVSGGMSAEEAGMTMLAPGESLTVRARLWIEK